MQYGKRSIIIKLCIDEYAEMVSSVKKLESIKIGQFLYISKDECCTKLSDAIIKKIEFIDFNDIESLDKDYIRISEFAKKINKENYIIKRLIEKNLINYKKCFGDYYIDIKEVERFNDNIINSLYEGNLDDEAECIELRTIEKLFKVRLKRQVESGQVIAEIINNIWYISKSDAEKFLANSKTKIEDYHKVKDLRNRPKFFTILDMSNFLGVSPVYVKKQLDSGRIKYVEIMYKGTKCKVVDEEEFLCFKNDLEKREQYYYNKDLFFTSKDIKTLFGISENGFRRNKEIMDAIKKPEIFNYKQYFHVSDSDTIKRILANQYRKGNTETTEYSLTGTAKELKIKYTTLAKLIEKGEFPNSYSIEKGKIKSYYIEAKDVEDFKNKHFYLYDSRFSPMFEVLRKYNLPQFSVQKELESNIYEFSNCKYCLTELVEATCEGLLKKQALLDRLLIDNDKSAAKDYFKFMYVDKIEIENSISETIDLFIKFTHEEISKSKANNLKNIVYNHGSSLLNLLKVIKNKELFKYNNMELDKIVYHSGINKTCRKTVGKFANYLRKEKREECSFTTEFVREASVSKEEKETYDFMTFIKFAAYISNVKEHINDAVENPRYTQIWFYIILHFCTAWRSGDFLMFPKCKIDIVGNRDLDWFCNNELDEKECETIIKMFSQHEYTVQKTEKKVPFQVFKLFKQAFSTALVLCECHTNNHNEDRLFYLFKKYSPSKKDIDKFLSKNPSLPSFKSLVANRSFLTNFYNYTNSYTEFSKVAYFLSKKLRGHVTANMTWEYIKNVDKEDIDTASKFIFDNEVFGFIKYMMAEIICLSEDKNFDELSLNEKRKYICSQNYCKDIIAIEALSKAMLLQQSKKIKVIELLLEYPKEALVNKLQRIYREELPTAVVGVQCFDLDKCPYNDLIKKPCEKCEFAIFNKQFLIEINKKIKYNIENLKSYDVIFQKPEIKRSSLRLRELLNMLLESQKEDIGLGVKVVSVYVDLEEIKIMLVEFTRNFIRAVEKFNNIIFKIGGLDNDNFLMQAIGVYLQEIPEDINTIWTIFDMCYSTEMEIEFNSLKILIMEHIYNTLNNMILERLDKIIGKETDDIEEVRYLLLILSKIKNSFNENCYEKKLLKESINFERIAELINVIE